MLSRSVLSLIAFSTCMAVSGVLRAESFLVDDLGNSGKGTLREAISFANANPGPDTIEFNVGLNGTIVLSSGLPQLTEDVDIIGPGAEVITVSGNFLHQPFFVPSASTVTIAGLTIADGRSSIGGGIGNEGSLTVVDCVLTNNSATSDGGAIDNNGGSLIVSHSRLTGNTAESSVGGGIFNDAGTLHIIDSTFSGNTAGFSGGAIYNQGSVIIERSTFSTNVAQEYGGAIENLGPLTVRNSTLSGNVANIEAGGGIDNFKDEATVEFSTLAENSAGSGGGIENTATITLKNSIVVNSTAGDNCFNDGVAFIVQGENFSTDDSCTGFTPTTAIGINLSPLANNGGPTQTHALLSGSVAVDAALDCTLSDGATPVTQDQRGQTRPEGPECDSGAFEGSESLPNIIFQDGFEGT